MTDEETKKVSDEEVADAASLAIHRWHELEKSQRKPGRTRPPAHCRRLASTFFFAGCGYSMEVAKALSNMVVEDE